MPPSKDPAADLHRARSAPGRRASIGLLQLARSAPAPFSRISSSTRPRCSISTRRPELVEGRVRQAGGAPGPPADRDRYPERHARPWRRPFGAGPHHPQGGRDARSIAAAARHRKKPAPVRAGACRSGRAGPASLLVTEPVRSGQRIFADRGDLVVVSSVSSGAELIAQGNIHVTARCAAGRLPGSMSATRRRGSSARARGGVGRIAGLYRTSDDLGPAVAAARPCVSGRDALRRTSENNRSIKKGVSLGQDHRGYLGQGQGQQDHSTAAIARAGDARAQHRRHRLSTSDCAIST